MYPALLDALRAECAFSDEAFAQITSLIRLIPLKKGEFLFREGEIDRYLAFVRKGCLRYYLIDKSGDEHTIYFATEAWWVGDMNSFFKGLPTLYFLQALEPTELLAFSKEAFQTALDTIPAFNEFFRIKTRQSYSAMQRRFVEQQAESAEEKYLKLIEAQPSLFQRVPQYLIASYLGIRPQSLSRIRKNLSAKG